MGESLTEQCRVKEEGLWINFTVHFHRLRLKAWGPLRDLLINKSGELQERYDL